MSLSRMLHAMAMTAVFLFSALPVWAAEPAKVGVVNVNLLIQQAPQAKAANKRLEKEFAPQQQQLQKLIRKLERLQADYQKNALTLTAEQKSAKEREVAMLTREIQRRRADLQELVNLRRNEELAKLQALINQAIRDIGQQEHYDLILYDGIAFSSKRIDLTPKILAYLKQLQKRKKAAFNQ
ncbi:OmpH family outer membrane protein [Sulfurivirga sp.]|uniref:OmpH family outer membrane protein n=1 Tax=Sulfurivirga sp. TaxID=2614236 RepID=UPI0025EF6591|nr:OmpH family outer membrane protein [Sulfurivirga sp.]